MIGQFSKYRFIPFSKETMEKRTARIVEIKITETGTVAIGTTTTNKIRIKMIVALTENLNRN